MKEAALVECITCGANAGWVCVNGQGKTVEYFHLQRKLLYVLRQTEPYSNLQIKSDSGYKEEQQRLRALLNDLIKTRAERHRQEFEPRMTVMDFVQEMEEL